MKIEVNENNVSVEFAGFATQLWNGSFYHVGLRDQITNYTLDLNSRFVELVFNYGSRGFSVKIFSSDNVATVDEITTGFLQKIDGYIDVNDREQHWQYSEYTSGVDYISDLKIGGHDLQKILESLYGKYVILQVEIER